MNFDLDFPRAYQFERSSGKLKKENSDFRVKERLPEVPTGDGEHLWLCVEKDGQNTAWVARQLAKWAGVTQRDVSYAGLKDRHAVTEQTFSIHLPGKETPSLDEIDIEGLNVLSCERHSKKLRTGQLIGNEFIVRVREFQGSVQDLENHWKEIAEHGIPNYFGPQRFGHGGRNIEKGYRWLIGEEKAPRPQQSIYLSAVRSFLFNHQLASRVSDGTWSQVQDGDFVQFKEGKTGFYCEAVDADVLARSNAGVLSPSASMPGVSKEVMPLCEAKEAGALKNYQPMVQALVDKGVSRQFRKLRTYPEQTAFDVIEGDPVFTFFLPAGCFATMVLHELIDTEVPDCNE